ncbi:lanC-like protein GCL2 [Pyrus ussuriensis x Pyrus communis]|uniref:LanC-like protein GCL2 n=1 Tax=Pyrus ussuriensis x Pyrus communis TaxID=2448454 RepID=A0A5N5HZX8_9ROSA|nr:lanC-like protein GCL2 [Pyrus ussuriensis x Pyrus communis]
MTHFGSENQRKGKSPVLQKWSNISLPQHFTTLTWHPAIAVGSIFNSSVLGLDGLDGKGSGEDQWDPVAVFICVGGTGVVRWRVEVDWRDACVSQRIAAWCHKGEQELSVSGGGGGA